MTIRAVFFDFGGVVARTEFQAPRMILAERLGMDYEQIEKAVFESESSRKASVGKLDATEHWQSVMRAIHMPAENWKTFRDEFFSGDVIDLDLIEYIKSLRPKHRTGLISNAWNDLRDYIIRHKFHDAFDEMIISAEVGVTKPDARIYHIALEKLNVRPEEAVFVDDFIENVDGCKAIGMHGIHFRSLEQTLSDLKLLLEN
jgi:epoxide hydrolase-like predicted phosphatase